MRKLALSDEILLQIEKPSRYIGNEVNAVDKSESPDFERDWYVTPGNTNSLRYV